MQGATDQLGLVFGQTAKSDVARQPFGSFTGSCFHTDLMRDINLTNKALGTVSDALAAAMPTVVSNDADYTDDGRVRSPLNTDGVGSLEFCDISPSAKVPGLYRCGSTADYLPACWPDPAGRANRVYCMHEPSDKTVERVYVSEMPDPDRRLGNAEPWAITWTMALAASIRIRRSLVVPAQRVRLQLRL